MPIKKKVITCNAVAEGIGVTPQTLSKWRNQDNSCPKESKNIDDWKAWMLKHKSTGRGTGRVAVEGERYTSADIVDLRAKLTAEQARKEAALATLRELELQMKRDNLIPESEATEQLLKLLTPLRRLLDALPRQIAAQANPQNPNIAELAIRNGLDDRVFAEIEKIMKLNK